MKTEQTNFWESDFGKEYTDRNTFTHEGLNNYYLTNYGITKDKLNEEFLGTLDKTIRILEVGCNIGMQLNALQKMGFTNLTGIELQAYAVEKAKQLTKGINIIQGSGFEIGFEDNSFDLVYTHGVLIHINPKDLPKIMSEMIRVSSKYIWGFEYYNDEIKQIPYRGHDGFMWKGDYCGLFQDQNANLKIVKKDLYPYITEQNKGNTDCMYLLSK
jgi:pseudaminic acid biosynthesis-associated methylase